MRQVFHPELCFVDGHVQKGLAIEVDDGLISAIGPASTGTAAQMIPGLVLPALANAHSHAFQRALRGRTYRRTPGQSDNFWSWREAMYAVALRLDPEAMYQIARMAYLDMLRSGFAAVGEFHYVHHQPDGTPYDDPSEMALAVIRAAQDVGLRIVLLRVGYARGGVGTPATARQQRFIDPDVSTFLDRLSALRTTIGLLDDPLVRFGVAPHSIRAVPIDWLRSLDTWLGDDDTPVHMHISEQRRELEESQREYGTTPLRVLSAETGLVDRRFVAVHGTHFEDAEVELMARADATICACPVTERDLGDGFLPASAIHRNAARLCLGTDSHCQIDGFAEMRLIEYHERLRLEQRNVLVDKEGDVAAYLFDVGTAQGFHALGLQGGRLAVGTPFDAVSVALDHSSVLGCEVDDLLAAIVFAGSPEMVRSVWVHGREVLTNGHHDAEREIERGYVAALERLRSQ